MKTKYYLLLACLTSLLVYSCGKKEDNNKEVGEETTVENDAAFSADALAEIVEYQRQKSGEEGTGEYNPWLSYGLKEMTSAADVTDDDYEYDEDFDDDDIGDDDEVHFNDADDDYESQPVVYFLGHNVDFKMKNNDISDFKKKSDDAVAVVDRFDNKASQIDILIFDKKLYDEFVKKGNDQVRYKKQGENVVISKGDSIATDVAVLFAGKTDGGYLVSIYSK